MDENCTPCIPQNNPQAPVCCGPLTAATNFNTSVSGIISAADPNGEAIMFSINGPPSNGAASVDFETGVWNYMPNPNFVGNDTFSLMATNQSGLSCSVVVNIQVVHVSAALYKASNTNQVCVGCTFEYTITSTNTGTLFIQDCIITDQLPPQMEVVGLWLKGAPISGDLGAGLHIGALGAGESAILVVGVKVLCAALACPFQNIAEGCFLASPSSCQPPITIHCTAIDCPGIMVQSPQLTLTKWVNQTATAVGETVMYSILVKNEGNVGFSNVLVLDSLDTNLVFQAGTLRINGHPTPSGSIISGVSLPWLAVGEAAFITFDALVLSQGPDCTVQNQAVATFDYEACQSNTLTSGSVMSNMVVLAVKKPSLLLKKSADKSLAVLGETLLYTITIQNDGDVEACSVILKDALSTTVKLIDGTFTVDGIQINGVNLEDGVFLGNIPVRKTVMIQYQVRVVSIDCKGLIINKVIASFGYSTSECGPIKRIDTTATSSETYLAISLFKQLNVKSDLMVQECKPDIEQINSVTGKVETTECYIVETPVGESREGQKLTGYKLIFHGMLNLSVEYTADVAEQKVHSELYYVPFSSFVVMQPDFDSNCQITLKAAVEDIYFRQMSNRRFFTNVTLLVIVNTR